MERKVSEIMTSNVITTTPDVDVVNAFEKLMECKISSLPVVVDEELLGIITATDVGHNLILDKYELGTNVEEIMIKDVVTVSPEDTVYILGDLCMNGDEKEWNRIYKNLNGYKNVIYGNHDTIQKLSKYVNDYGMHLLDYGDMYQYSKKKKFYLSHYPTLVGNHEEKKFLYNLSGHTHSTDIFQYGWGNVYNVSMDAHNCTPVSIEQIIKDIENY